MAGNPYVIDFSGPQNALASWGQRQMQQRQMEQQQGQFDASNLLARDQFGELQRQHNTTNALARDNFGLAQNKNEFETGPLAQQYRQAQIDDQRAAAYMKRQHGEAYRAQGAARSAGGAAQPVWGQRENGEIYRLDGSGTTDAGDGAVEVGDGDSGVGRFSPGYRAESDVRGSRSDAPPPQPRLTPNGQPIFREPKQEHPDLGAYDVTTPEVPGIVTRPNRSRTMDKPATEFYQGARATNKHPDAVRMEEFKANQDQWTYMLGKKASSGKMYSLEGREVPIGPLATAQQSQKAKDRAIEIVRSNIDGAEKALLSGGNIARSAAAGMDQLGTAGRFLQTPGMEKLNAAFSKYEEGVMQMVYALSGKQTTNKEMERFIAHYMPRPGESDDRIREKTTRLKRMITTLQTKVKSGMLYEDAEYQAMVESGASGKSAPAGVRTPANPAADRLKSKYGLE